MTNTIVAFDLETTGLNTQTDHIVQIGLIRFDSTTFEELDSLSWYVRPDVKDFEFAPEAQEKTGLTKEFILENGVFLKDIWYTITEFIGTDDILSYNGNHFDVPMLYYNLLRYNLSFDFDKHVFYDSLTIERNRFSMKLENTYKRYTGQELQGAHDALCDVRALIQVFKHQIQNDENVFDPSFNLLSPEGFIKYNEKGDIVFANGKYKGKTTNDVCKTDPGYIRWIVEKFSSLTVETIKNAWLAEKQANQAKDNL